LRRTGTRIGPLTAIHANQPFGRYIDCGQGGFYPSKKAFRFVHGNGFTLHQNIGFDIRQPIFCPMGA
jgi:hypothetical protein